MSIFANPAVTFAKDYFCHVANTVFCMYQKPFSEQWDLRLQHIIEDGEVLSVSEHVITFACDGDVLEVWKSNRWYSYGTLYRVNGEHINSRLEARPRFRTMRQLHSVVCLFWKPAVTRETFYRQSFKQGELDE